MNSTDVLKGPKQATPPNRPNASRPKADPHQQVSDSLDLAVQDKAQALKEAADIGAAQAVEEEMTEFASWTAAKFQAKSASTKAKAQIRKQLRGELETVATPISIELPGDVESFFSGFGGNLLTGS